jgi:hypothetical protein
MGYEIANLAAPERMVSLPNSNFNIEHERQLRLGLAGHVAIVVVHTWPDTDDDGKTRAHHQRAQRDAPGREGL